MKIYQIQWANGEVEFGRFYTLEAAKQNLAAETNRKDGILDEDGMSASGIGRILDINVIGEQSMSYQHAGTWSYFNGKDKIEYVNSKQRYVVLQKIDDELVLNIATYLDDDAIQQLGFPEDVSAYCWFFQNGSQYIPMDNIFAFLQIEYPRMISLSEEEEL